MKLFGVYKNTDMIEGRGRMELYKLFTNEDDAIACYNNHGSVRGFYDIREIEAYESYDDSLVVEKQKALNKLTEYERKLLGL